MPDFHQDPILNSPYASPDRHWELDDGSPAGRVIDSRRACSNLTPTSRTSTGEVVSGEADDIACWFIDNDCNEESFFVRHAYFLGQGDPYKSLRTTLKAEFDAEAWASLNRDTSRPFPKPTTVRIGVKVINHLGDEVMKEYPVSLWMSMV